MFLGVFGSQSQRYTRLFKASNTFQRLYHDAHEGKQAYAPETYGWRRLCRVRACWSRISQYTKREDPFTGLRGVSLCLPNHEKDLALKMLPQSYIAANQIQCLQVRHDISEQWR